MTRISDINWKLAKQRPQHPVSRVVEELRKRRASNALHLTAFTPLSLEERLAKLKERLDQAWPSFGPSGLYEVDYLLHASDHTSGTVVRFFSDGRPTTFDSLGVIKHGAYWYLSEVVNGFTRFTNKEMQEYLRINKLNWVVVQ